MAVPSFAPLPPATIRLSLGPEEWEACLDSWLTLCDLSLRLSTDDFVDSVNDDDSLPAFLTSFYREVDGLKLSADASLSSPKALALRKSCFKLVSRAYTEWSPISKSLLTWDFLAQFCHTHLKNAVLPQLMSDFWQTKGQMIMFRLQKQKGMITKSLEAPNDEALQAHLSQLAPIVHASADIGAFFMTGSDFLDALMSAYSRNTSDDRKKPLSTVVYLGLLSLLKAEESNVSLLSDHLYTLKSQADKAGPGQSILADVITNTSLLARIRRSGTTIPDRLSKLLDSLETYRTPSIARPKKRSKRSTSKGKGKQKAINGDFHIHQMSLVTQVQDLFPDLGSGFVLKLLDEYNDDVEQVTAHLLEETLPPHLASLNRTEQVPVEDASHDDVAHLAPRAAPPLPEPFIPERRTVFDDDELDRLDFDTSRLHIGKRNRTDSTDDHPNKAAILSALAAFDSDDDERDDTYDVEDVGGTVDNAHPDGEPGQAVNVTNEENDMALFSTYKTNPELFGRTFDIRRGQARQALKKETGMTDEAIEGWAIMLQRDPKRLRRLEAQGGPGAFDGKQTELASTAYRESPGNTETEDSDAGQGNSRGGLRGRGRGRGRGHGGRGGNVSGPRSDPSTAQAQRRKEASKGSRANHNRRDQRARKVARAGFPG